ncbi:hypothetical protein CTZ27_37085 [Streptomyces griseocarneus]|nr:hypothetical protein CTZ27_37085 [Streptomyces griseocarneus]
MTREARRDASPHPARPAPAVRRCPRRGPVRDLRRGADRPRHRFPAPRAATARTAPRHQHISPGRRQRSARRRARGAQPPSALRRRRAHHSPPHPRRRHSEVLDVRHDHEGGQPVTNPPPAPAPAGAGPGTVLSIIVRDHRPAAQGSKRHVGKGRLIEQSRRVAPWRAAVEAAARSAATEHGLDGPLDGPLSVEVTFTVRKPASAPKRRRSWPITRDSGDLDKLQRAVFDALTVAGVIADDSRIVEVTARKVYPVEDIGALDAPGARIRIVRLG